MTKTKSSRAKRYAAKALRRLIEAGRKTPAIYAAIAKEMSDRSNEPFHRQEVAVWLHENEAKRVEPRLGAGLLMIESGSKLTEPEK